MPPKYVFNHIVIYDPIDDLWCVYHKQNKKIVKTADAYGRNAIAKGKTIDLAIESAVEKGIKRWDIQILKP